MRALCGVQNWAARCLVTKVRQSRALGHGWQGGCAVCGALGRSSVKICHPVCLRFEHILHLSCFNKKGTLKIKHLHFRDVEAVGS